MVFLDASDKEGVAACYDRFLEYTNGLMEKQGDALDGLFRAQRLKIVGVKEGGKVRGYLAFLFKMREADNFLWQDIMVHELIYDDREALLALLTFLHTQADQVDRVVFNLQSDDFHPHDPRHAGRRGTDGRCRFFFADDGSRQI